MQHTQNNENLIFHLSIHRICFLTYQEKKILSKKLDSSYSLALLSIEEICKFINRDINVNRVNWDGKENLHMAEVAAHYCRTLGIKVILNTDKNYPLLLSQISDPPYLLFCRGNENLLNDNCVSVVGTRRLSPDGKIAARNFSYEAVLNGFNVVSGLANGADGFAHKGATDSYFDCIEKGIDTEILGKTIAVLPSSIDEIVPHNHALMAANILKSGGCIISEYEPGMCMEKWHFVARNRIIAGMSPGTVVIEAPPGSGALITAEFALEYNRDVMFHKVAFEGFASVISEKVHSQLEKELANGRISKCKIENRPEKYLEAGAPVVGSFKEYYKNLGYFQKRGSVLELQEELF